MPDSTLIRDGGSTDVTPPDSDVQPAPDISALSANPINPALDAPQVTPPPAQQPQPQQHKMGRLLAFVDALTGGAGVVGGVHAALDPNRYSQQQEARKDVAMSNVKFSSARAAQAVAQATMDQYHAEHLPEEIQDQHEQTALQTVNVLKNIFPVAAVTNHTNQSAAASLQSMSSDNPAGVVPHTISVTLPSSGQTISFSTEKAGIDPAAFNSARQAAGFPPLDEKVIKALKPEKVAELLDNAYSLWTTTPGDSKSTEALLAQVQNAKNAYAARTPDWQSDRKQMLAKFDARIKDVQNTLSFYDARERQHALNRAVNHAAAAEHIRTADSPLGDTTDLDSKTYNQRTLSMKKDLDNLQKTEATYNLFQRAAADAASGKDISGSEAVSALFAAISLSAEPLKGAGFRLSQPVIAEHVQARGVPEALRAKLAQLKTGQVISNQQILDYAKIAAGSRHDAYLGTVDKARSFGLKADPYLPHGHNQPLDADTAKIFLDAADGDQTRAAKAARALRWRF